MRADDLGGEFFHLRGRLGTGGRRGEAEERAVLVGADEAAAGIDRHGHPRALFALGDEVDAVDAETVDRAKLGRGGGAVEHVAPGGDAGGADDMHGLEGCGFGRGGGPIRAGFHEVHALARVVDGESQQQPGGAAVVGGFDAQGVDAGFQERLDVGAHGRAPVVEPAGLEIVDEDPRVVVAGEFQRGGADVGVGVEGVEKDDLFVGGRGRSEPDPLRRGGGGDGQQEEEKGGETAGRMFHGGPWTPEDADHSKEIGQRRGVACRRPWESPSFGVLRGRRQAAPLRFPGRRMLANAQATDV